MAKQMIAELKPGEPVEAPFLVAAASLRTTRNDSLYLDITLADRSGTVKGRLWDATEAMVADIKPDDFVTVKGTAESYRNELQIGIKAITRCPEGDLRLRDFIPASASDPQAMFDELVSLLERVEDADCRALLDAFLDDEAFCRAYASKPAAKANHHAYLGGLLEHTLSMMKAGVLLLDHYTALDADLLLTGIFLHDIGKIEELATKRSFDYTAPGHLVGHIMLGVLLLEEKARGLADFPEIKLNLLRHLILSHHGRREFGSPQLPMTAEAIMLHYLDNLDAKLQEFAEIVAADKNADPDFTDYARLFEGRLYKGGARQA
jgi:3'-5' exoribonuclease